LTAFIDIPNSNDFQKLSGHIKNFRKSRETANFFFTARDQSNMRLGAILSALVGDSGQAATLSNYASSMEGIGDYVQFELEGRRVYGWLWGSPFKDGDYVEAVIKKQGGSYELFALYKPAERTIALYPHCIKGTRAYLRAALRRTLFANAIFITALSLLFLFGGKQSLEQGIKFISSREALGGSLPWHGNHLGNLLHHASKMASVRQAGRKDLSCAGVSITLRHQFVGVNQTADRTG
jgi:hypothetical protein